MTLATLPLQDQDSTDLARDPRVRLLLELGRALHSYGAAAHHLEDALTLGARPLGIEGQFFATPTAFFAAFTDGDRSTTQLLRVEPGEVNLEKLVQCDDILGDILYGRFSAPEIRQRLRDVVAAPPRFGPPTMVAGFALASASAVCFFGGSGGDCLAAAALGGFTGLLSLLCARSRAFARVFEPAAALLATVLATLAAHLFPVSSPSLVTLGGLIVLLPGLTVTVALQELATRNLASGTARFLGACTLLLSIGFGVALGQKLAGFLPAPALTEATMLPRWVQWLALLVAPLGFTILFRARPRDAGWILAAGVVGFFAARLGARELGVELGAFLGAFAVGLGSNVLVRFTRKPAQVTLIPGLMLLVPGSLGFRSFGALLEQDVAGGMEAAFQMVLVAMSLVAGVLFAGLAVPPRQAL